MTIVIVSGGGSKINPTHSAVPFLQCDSVAISLRSVGILKTIKGLNLMLKESEIDYLWLIGDGGVAMLSYDAENEMSRRKAEAKALGDVYWQTAHLRSSQRSSRFSSITRFIGNLLRHRRSEFLERDASQPITDRPAFR
jgi:hypothetical protein